MLLLGIVACEVRMDTLGDVAEEGLEAGRRVELLSASRASPYAASWVSCACWRGFFGSAAGGVGVVEVDFAFGDARFEIVELGIENTDLTEITAFKGLELGADLGKLRFALGET